MDYFIKPFHPAKATQVGKPSCDTHTESARPTPQCQLASPDVSLTPASVPTMKRLALDKGAEWCRILREARQQDASGKTLLQRFSLDEVAKLVNTSAPTLSRLLKKFGKLSDAELTPERLAPVKAGGRTCDWEFLLKDAGVRAKLLELYTATIGASSAASANDRRTAKLSTALRNFPYEPECPEELKKLLRGGYEPVPFVTYLRGCVTPEMEAKVRGPKHYQLYGPSSVRDWTCRLPNGDRFEMPACYGLSMDDQSENHPFFVEQRSGEIILSRQGLYALWAKHKVWQSVELVGRTHESYQAADILRAFYKMCLAMGGVPPFVEFEQGIWRAKKISGFKRDGEWLVEETVERPGMAQKDMNSVADGLGLCGVKVLYKTKAHQKHIETHFNSLQTVMAIVARQFQCIGRYAGEFEHPGKQLRRIRAGSHHPSELKFASQSQLADCVAEAFRRIGELPSAVEGKTRYEAHWDDLNKVGLLPLTPRLFAACLPGELRKTTLRNGYIHVESRGQDFQFRHEDFAKLGDGYELYYKFDDTDPNLGCAVFNRTSQSNSANFQKWQPGEFMFCAAREIPGPKLEVSSAPAGVEIKTIEQQYGAGAVDRGDSIRRKQDKFVATQFRSMPRPGQIAVRSAAARDGRGNVVEVSNQSATGRNGAAAQPQDTSSAAAVRAQHIATPEGALPPRPSTAKPAQLPYSLRKILQEQHDAVPK